MLFEKLTWLPLNDEIKLQKYSLIFRRVIGDTPNRMYLLYPRYNRETEGGRTFQINGIKLWNIIPIEIRKKGTIGSFKSALKKHFYSSC